MKKGHLEYRRQFIHIAAGIIFVLLLGYNLLDPTILAWIILAVFLLFSLYAAGLVPADMLKASMAL